MKTRHCAWRGFAATARRSVILGVGALAALLVVSGPAPSADGDSSPVYARTAYTGLVPLAAADPPRRFANLLYEGNNLWMRGPASDDGTFVHGGARIAQDWRRLAGDVRGVFVLRDSLFSQQDHPFRNDPFEPLLPPGWVLAVADAASDHRPFSLPQLPAGDEDAAWRRFDSAAALFGDLPPSTSLYRAATATGAAASYARATLAALYSQARQLLAVLDQGAGAVANTGARLIAASDRAYFGTALRRERVIPILIEHPYAYEIGEAKGIHVPGLRVRSEVRQLVVHAICRRRLADGDIALERYDLSSRRDRRRAIDMLEAVIPRSAAGAATSRVWLWVTGTLEPVKGYHGEDARAYVEDFRTEAAAAAIDITRLRLFSKPPVDPPTDRLESVLAREAAVFDRLDLSMSVARPDSDRALQRLLCCETAPSRNLN